MSWNQIAEMLLHMLDASKMTLLVFVLTLAFALPLGMLVAVGRMSKIKIISWIIQAYLLVMRGTPLILQLIFFYFAPDLIGIHLTRFQAAIVAFTLNYAAYFAEIYRGGIESVPLGQREAANVLGLSRTHTFFRIVLPQVVKKVLAAHEQRIHDSGQGYRPGPDHRRGGAVPVRAEHLQPHLFDPAHICRRYFLSGDECGGQPRFQSGGKEIQLLYVRKGGACP